MPAALNRADKNLVQCRRNESQRQLRKSGFENRNIILTAHLLARKDLYKFVKYIYELIVKLLMFISRCIIFSFLSFFNPVLDCLPDLQRL